MPDLTKPLARIADARRKINKRGDHKLDLLRKTPDGMVILAENLAGWEKISVKEDEKGKRVYSFKFYDVDKKNNAALSTFTHLRLNDNLYVKGKSPLGPDDDTQLWTIYVEPRGEE